MTVQGQRVEVLARRRSGHILRPEQESWLLYGTHRRREEIRHI
jgi:hypothetical protein